MGRDLPRSEAKETDVRIQLTMSKNYRPSWGVWEGVREVAQNFLDAHDEGYEGEVTHKNDVLTFVNRGADLRPAQMVLLGEGTKAGSKARGEHADGLKVGLLALVRGGHRVTIKVGGKLWNATIEKSRQYSREVLTLESRNCRAFNGVEIKIWGISEELWRGFRKNLLPLRGEEYGKVETSHGNILLDPSERGRLYVKGIFVCRKDGLSYGYDFHREVSLDVDRRIVGSFDLAWNTSRMVSEAFHRRDFDVDQYLEVLSRGKSEAEYASSFVGARDFELVERAWEERHGMRAVPVPAHESEEAQPCLDRSGLKLVPCEAPLAQLFKSNSRGWRERSEEEQQAVRRRFEWAALEEEERQNFLKLSSLFAYSDHDIKFGDFEFVEFVDPDLDQRVEDGRALLARKVLQRPRQLLHAACEAACTMLAVDPHAFYVNLLCGRLDW
jgi:hypothetical protein